MLAGYAYAGDLDRGWQVVGWQGKAALVGGGVGLALVPVLIWGRPSSPLDPHGGASAMLWLPVAPVVGALVAHTAHQRGVVGRVGCLRGGRSMAIAQA